MNATRSISANPNQRLLIACCTFGAVAFRVPGPARRAAPIMPLLAHGGELVLTPRRHSCGENVAVACSDGEACPPGHIASPIEIFQKASLRKNGPVGCIFAMRAPH